MIRSVTKNDYEEIAKLMVEAFKNPPWNEVWSYERSYQRIEQLDDGKYTRCFVYMLDNKIAVVVCGKLITYVNDLDFMIEDFYIDPHCQRRGLGKKMMKALEECLPEVDDLILLTGREFYSADFYQKNGFKINDDMVFMVKKLKS